MTDREAASKNSGTFSLIRLRPECKLPPVRVDFIAPQLYPPFYAVRSQHQLPSSPPSTPTAPISRPASSSRSIRYSPQATQKYYQENLTFERLQFQEKIQRSVQETNSVSSGQPSQEIRIAPPHSDYCQICQHGFLDYFEHIRDKAHRAKASRSQATGLISGLCAHVEGASKESGRKGKGKTVRKAGRKERSWRGKVRGSKKEETSKGEGSSKGGSFSTCLVEDCSIGPKE